MTAWDVRGGIQRKMWILAPLGDTSIFGGYLEINDGIGGACGATRACKSGTFPDLPSRPRSLVPKSPGGTLATIRRSTQRHYISMGSISTSRLTLTSSTPLSPRSTSRWIISTSSTPALGCISKRQLPFPGAEQGGRLRAALLFDDPNPKLRRLLRISHRAFINIEESRFIATA
jgi:hypothetical protein